MPQRFHFETSGRRKSSSLLGKWSADIFKNYNNWSWPEIGLYANT